MSSIEFYNYHGVSGLWDLSKTRSIFIGEVDGRFCVVLEDVDFVRYVYVNEGHLSDIEDRWRALNDIRDCCVEAWYAEEPSFAQGDVAPVYMHSD